MQRLAAQLVGEDIGTAVIEQHEVELLRPVVVTHAGPQRRVRVHPLAGGGARQQLQEHLEVAPLRQHLLDPHHRDQHPRQREAHPPVALGLHDANRAGLGHGEVRPRRRHRNRQELLAQVAACGLRDCSDLPAEILTARDRVLEQQLDLRPVAVDGRHENVGGSVVAKLVDQLRQVGLDRLHALRGQRIVQTDLVRRERLDLDHLTRAVLAGDPAHDCVALGGVTRPMHLPARTRYRRLQPLQLLRQRGHRTSLDRRAGVPQRLPIGHLRDPRGASRADRVRCLTHVTAHLCVSKLPTRGGGKPGRAHVAARISARCITRTPAR